MEVVVFTCDRYLWCLRPFAFLFNTFWSPNQKVVIAGYSSPDFPLPENFRFYSIDTACYPADRWSDGVIRFLRQYDYPHFVLMLEDYWLCRKVDVHAVEDLGQLISLNPAIWRIDLTGDRLHSGAASDFGTWGHLDLISTPNGTPYQVSIQAGIFSRDQLLRLLRPGISPWQFELMSMPADDMITLGTRQMPVRYVIGVISGGGQVKLNDLSLIPLPYRSQVYELCPPEIRASEEMQSC